MGATGQITYVYYRPNHVMPMDGTARLQLVGKLIGSLFCTFRRDSIGDGYCWGGNANIDHHQYSIHLVAVIYLSTTL